MSDCGKYEGLLARYLHGESLLQDRERLEEHLAVCPDCERLYRDVSDMDLLLRDLPGKQVEPPGWLHARILANLPEEKAAPFGERWGRWAAGFAAAAACALVAAVMLFRGGPVPPTRVATAPPPAAQSPGIAVPAPESATKPPVLRAAPDASRPRSKETVVASAPKVRVIKEVKIFFYYPPAQKVAVTGDFNNWDVDGVPLNAAGKPGLWETDLRIPPGVYSYNFIVDGELLVPDPNAANQMPDGYGGTNSILLVKGENHI
jgi:hypothetical protein